ncbi:tripartite ATP-independent transporter DctM subunit [Tamaricihabitans halophyticus]|uniref:Tripartite ATP-independent transporter DctM subunit n=1 Tax=Tamaricihabitans halophyticus TaxID=1262583 RepID=A0A4R2Q3Y0_9PSEU|nr:TRAP transporter large permease [Tamaricihabitans halophyticus]TCP43432.1 tripartite ATP-independent transporter DctM subunit [Tamaricihabitans halophyticus]
MELILLFGVLFGLMLLGAPIFVAMLASALVTLAVTGLGAATVLPTQMASGVGATQLLAIPFFILMGELMSRAGLTQRIVELLMFFFGRFRGGLAHVVVGVNAFASSVSGSAPASASMVSSATLPAMRDNGYRPAFSSAVNASAAVLGPVMPPSVPLVFVSLVTTMSLGQLFIGGIGPGVLMAIVLFGTVALQARRGKLPGPATVPAEAARPLPVLFLRALPALGAPVFIIVGVIGGFVTITEVAIIAAFYVLVLGLFYRTISLRALPAMLRDSSVFSSTIMMLFAAVGGFTFIIAAQRVGDQVAAAVARVDMGPLLFFLLAALFFLLIGMVLDAVPAILIFLPILMPVATELGIDPIHFGVATVVNLMIGLLTPPVGALLFVLTKIGKVSFASLLREVWPFLGGLLVALLVVILAPPVVTFLPGLFFGG